MIHWLSFIIVHSQNFYLRYLSGEAEAILAVAHATTKRISLVSEAIKNHGGMEVILLCYFNMLLSIICFIEIIRMIRN